MSFLNIAHRGASVDAPENTLEAFALAIDQRADMIETDLHLMRCGEIALYHDDKIDGIDVADLTLEELRSRQPGVPTLVETLDSFGKRISFNLEFKRSGDADYEGLEARVLEEVNSRGLIERTLFSSFYDSILARVRSLEPRARIGLLVSSRSAEKVEERARRLSAEACHLFVSLVSRERTAELHDEGFRVHVYTVDDAEKQNELVEFGVDGIFTNVPARLRALLDA
ncbi:MAG: glycerophosphodiester phosphodiesterase [bacterium]|nr:glycerophosphodiester phosphodiesterase [bacterium]